MMSTSTTSLVSLFAFGLAMSQSASAGGTEEWLACMDTSQGNGQSFMTVTVNKPHVNVDAEDCTTALLGAIATFELTSDDSMTVYDCGNLIATAAAVEPECQSGEPFNTESPNSSNPYSGWQKDGSINWFCMARTNCPVKRVDGFQEFTLKASELAECETDLDECESSTMECADLFLERCGQDAQCGEGGTCDGGYCCCDGGCGI